MMEKERLSAKPHHLRMDDRKVLTLTGISDVDSFDEKEVIAYTDWGELSVLGSHLQITKWNRENGDMALEGKVDSLTYTENRRKGGFFSRLFR